MLELIEFLNVANQIIKSKARSQDHFLQIPTLESKHPGKRLVLRWSNTSSKLLQSVALQVEKRCCTNYHPPQTLSHNKIASWSSMLQHVELASTFFKTYFFNLQQQNFAAWQCFMRWVVMQRFSTCNATMLYCKLKKNFARITGPLRQDDNWIV